MQPILEELDKIITDLATGKDTSKENIVTRLRTLKIRLAQTEYEIDIEDEES